MRFLSFKVTIPISIFKDMSFEDFQPDNRPEEDNSKAGNRALFWFFTGFGALLLLAILAVSVLMIIE